MRPNRKKKKNDREEEKNPNKVFEIIERMPSPSSMLNLRKIFQDCSGPGGGGLLSLLCKSPKQQVDKFKARMKYTVSSRAVCAS